MSRQTCTPCVVMVFAFEYSLYFWVATASYGARRYSVWLSKYDAETESTCTHTYCEGGAIINICRHICWRMRYSVRLEAVVIQDRGCSGSAPEKAINEH